jgi:hypothetical protein
MIEKINYCYVVVNRDNKHLYPVVFSSSDDAENYGYSLRSPYDVCYARDMTKQKDKP